MMFNNLILKYFQANLENIRELKLGMKQLEEAKYIANFSTALITAFDILQQVSGAKIYGILF